MKNQINSTIFIDEIDFLDVAGFGCGRRLLRQIVNEYGPSGPFFISTHQFPRQEDLSACYLGCCGGAYGCARV